MAKSLAEEFGFGKNAQPQTADTAGMKIAGMLFKAQLDAHITHLEQKDKTLARHEAMSKFYEGIDGLVDTFVETYMGLYPIAITTEASKCIDNPLDYFTNLYNTIDKSRTPIKESFLQNQIDEIQQLIAHTLYRLKNIQS